MIGENLVVEYDEFVVPEGTTFAEVVRDNLDSRPDRTSCLGLVEDYMVRVGIVDPTSCSGSLLSGDWCLSRLGYPEVIGAEESCFDRDTVGPELVDRELIGERKAV